MHFLGAVRRHSRSRTRRVAQWTSTQTQRTHGTKEIINNSTTKEKAEMFERPSLRRAPGQRLLSVHHFVQRLLFFAQSPRLCVVGIAHCNANNGAIIDDGPFLHFFIPISIHLPIDLRQLHSHSKMPKSGAAQTRRSRFWAVHGSHSE